MVMDKRKARTEKPKRVTVETTESTEITFEEFERTMTKVVRSKPVKTESVKHKKSQ